DVVVSGRVQQQRAEDRQRHSDEIEREQREHARGTARGCDAQQERQRRRALASHIVIRGLAAHGALGEDRSASGRSVALVSRGAGGGPRGRGAGGGGAGAGGGRAAGEARGGAGAWS